MRNGFEYRRVTDGQADGRTDGRTFLRRHSPRYAQHRAVKIFVGPLAKTALGLC